MCGSRDEYYFKSSVYCAIATAQAKTNPEEANQTLRISKETANLIEDDKSKSKAYCDIATEEAKTNPEAAKETVTLIQDTYSESIAYCDIARALVG